MSKRQLKLGLFLHPTGQHIAAWRLPGAAVDMHVNLQRYVEMVGAAERAKFDLFFLADGDSIHDGAWSRDILARTANRSSAQFEPITLLSAIAATTSRIGLVATASTTYNQPFRLARQFASLDVLSGGRAGWNVVTASGNAAAANFGASDHPEHTARYERASEFVDVVTGLWDSWEDDAFLRDQESGLFFDHTKLHTLDHVGPHFSVKGPLNVGRSPQGHPVVVQAGSSEPGQDLAARTAEVVFTAQNDLTTAKDFYASVKRRLPAYGRSPDDVKIMPGFCPIVAATEEEAKRKFESMQELIDPAVGLAHLATLLGIDLTGYPLDEPVPDLPETNGMKSRHELFLRTARREGLTLRQLFQNAAGSKGHLLVVGTAVQIADRMEEWLVENAADGFNVMPALLPAGLTDFIEHVLPELRRRGLFRTDYEGRTLRDHLGLKRPVNRHAWAGRDAAE
jgi:FMN-dependent oxidoreductase (nitrilotriacetate monooxygenase family)